MLTRRKILSLAIPIVLAQAATATTGIVDTAAMGRFGDKADLAAVAIAAVAYSIIYWGFGFLRMSTTGLAAQANGRGDGPEVRAILLRAMMLGGAIGLGLFLLSPLLRWLTFAAFASTAEVESLAAGYFNARIFGAPAYLMGLGITG
ncbi:MATE family efflux transporter [Hyphomonas sp.]|uniref:MATE family efflux transporter n=1 Tax=Hyphomonas sp. TaxID=87 RepID=UPI0035615F9F